MKIRYTQVISAAALTALTAAVADASPLVNVQILGSVNGGAFSNTLTVTPNATVSFEVVEQIAPSGTTNTTKSITLGTQTSADGVTSLSFNLSTNASDASFASGALSSAWTTPPSASSGNLTSGGISAIIAQTGAGTFLGGTAQSQIFTGNLTVGSSSFSTDTIGGIYYTGSGTTGNFKVLNSTGSTKTVQASATTESSGDPLFGFTGLTLNEAATALMWDGTANGNWDTSSLNFTNGTAVFSTGAAVTFGDFAANGTTAVKNTNPISIVSGGVQPTSVIFTNTSLNTYRFTDSDSTNGIGGNASVAINGGGTVIFSSPNSYSGGTNITSGTLKAASGSLLSTGALTIGASGKLAIGDGSSSVPATLATGAETWTGGGALAAKVDPNGTADQLTIGGGTGTVALGGTGAFTVSLQPGDVALGTPSNGTTWQIATFGSLSGYSGTLPSGSGVANGVPVNSQFALDTSALNGVPSANFSLDLVQITSGQDALDVVYAATPEPATTMLVLGAVAPMLMARRRRNRGAADAIIR